MDPIPRVCIVGPGAMGAFYYSKFYNAQSASVSFVAGGERKKRLEANGLVINDQHLPAKVTDISETGPTADLIILAVKYHHLDQAITDMKNQVSGNTRILSVMNGIDSEELLIRAFGEDKVLYAVALGIDALRQDNTVRYTQEGTLYFGELTNPELSDRAQQVSRYLDLAGIVYHIPEDMGRVLWWKYMINIGVNQVSAALRAPFGVFQKTSETRDLMDMAMQEVREVARAEGINLTREDIDNWHEILYTLSPRGRTSMCQDVEAGRKTEVEMFAGKLIEVGARHNLALPVNTVLFKLIRTIEQNYG